MVTRRLAEQCETAVSEAALYSPRAADLPVWGATVKVLYMTYCGKSESAAVPVGIALQQCRAAAVPVGIALRGICYVLCSCLHALGCHCSNICVCVSAACIVRFFLIAARLAQAQTVRAVSEH